MENIDSENCGITIMYLATSLCEKYEDWKTDENFIKVADVNSNKICLGLRELYPHISVRVMQSIALAYSLYFYLLVNNEMNKFDNEQLINNNLTTNNNHTINQTTQEKTLFDFELD